MITISNVSKTFGTHRANNNISLTIARGRITGLLGPNGAGKTTLIRMMTNIIKPDEGSILFDGSPMNDVARNSIGYLPEERGLYKKLTVRQQLLYFARLKGLSHSVAAERATQWLHRMNAADWMPKKVQELSKGMQQKVQFISTILHEPSLLILDEPFSGLDPVNASLLIDVIKELKANGTSMDQVEKLCDDLALIDRGELVLSGSVRDVRNRFRSNRLHLRFEGDPASLSNISGATLVHQTDGSAEFLLSNDVDANDVIRAIVDRVSILAVEQSAPSLHDIFVETVTKRSPQTQDTDRGTRE
jgi:ABC-2 type transport system ATP-binding protein